MTVSAQDAHPFPIYNARFRLIVPLLDADGDPISPSSPDTELSQDLGTFADATNEATEIATSSGVVYIDLIATELDTTSTAVRVQSTGAKTTIAVLNPRRLPIIRTGTAQAGAATTITLDSGASAIDDYYVGCYVNCTNDTPANVRGQARMIIDYAGSTKIATVATWGTNPSSSTTFEILATELWIQCLADVNALLGTAMATPINGWIIKRRPNRMIHVARVPRRFIVVIGIGCPCAFLNKPRMSRMGIFAHVRFTHPFEFMEIKPAQIRRRLALIICLEFINLWRVGCGVNFHFYLLPAEYHRAIVEQDGSIARV